MPARNIVKEYLEGGIYHVYNRGTDKRVIFVDEEDYVMFMHIMKTYLTVTMRQQAKIDRGEVLSHKNYTHNIKLLSFCLMPNHFHLMIEQVGEHDISDFMRSLLTNYVMYFNKKYHRSGGLFQGRYKAVIVGTQIQMLHLTRYIHMNPLSLFTETGPMAMRSLRSYEYSSYQSYLGTKKLTWLQPENILTYFSSVKPGKHKRSEDYLNYQNYLEDYALDSVSVLRGLTIEKDDVV